MTKSDMVLIPNEELLSAECIRYAELAVKLEKHQEQLRRSREEWAPAYESWYAKEVAPLAARARELRQRARDRGVFISAVEEAARVLYCTPIEAKAKVSAAMRGAIIFEELYYEFHEGNPFPNGPLHPDAEMHFRLKFARSKFPMKDPSRLEELFQVFLRGLLDQLFGWRELPANAFDEARLKRLYRELARRLNPDVNPATARKELDLWQEVHTAFRAQDCDTLENVLAMLECGGRFEQIDGLGRLRAILVRIEARLNEAKREVRAESRRPWWKFGKAKDRGVLAQILRQEHEHSIQLAEAELARQAATLKRWEYQTL